MGMVCLGDVCREGQRGEKTLIIPLGGGPKLRRSEAAVLTVGNVPSSLPILRQVHGKSQSAAEVCCRSTEGRAHRGYTWLLLSSRRPLCLHCEVQPHSPLSGSSLSKIRAQELEAEG